MSMTPDDIVREALALLPGLQSDAWSHGRIGLSAAHDVEAFRACLPAGARWDLARPFRARLVDGKWQTQGVSTCGLVAVGILCRAGARLSWMTDPYWRWQDPQQPDRGAYRGLDVVSCLSLLGHRRGARRAAGAYPRPGDVVCIGSGLATHVLTVVSVDGHYVWSVDGGQVEPTRGLQCVKLLRRDWRGVRVQWVMDAAML